MDGIAKHIRIYAVARKKRDSTADSTYIKQVNIPLGCIGVGYFRSSRSRTRPDLGSKSDQSQMWIWGKLVFGSQNKTPDELMPSTMLSATIKRQYSVYFVMPLPVYDEICGRAMDFVPSE